MLENYLKFGKNKMCEEYEKLAYNDLVKHEEMMEEDEIDDNLYHIPIGKGRCLDCERHEHLSKLKWFKLPSRESGYEESFDRTIYEALMWILENTEYPVGE